MNALALRTPLGNTEAHQGAAAKQALSIVCFSGEWDKLFAAFTIANGALAMGKDVHVFITFWATAAFDAPQGSKPSLMERVRRWFLRPGPDAAPLSKLNFFGFGRALVSMFMKKHGVESLPTLIDEAKQLGVHLYYCDMSMRLLGYQPKNFPLGERDTLCGVATFLRVTEKCQQTLFI
ncbi:MAG: DsrE/DsrF/DrsH-like family protein [Deltaproteobacteria bacterium]|nr:DsrE/DsrF/DrsH-like family protein [Deltaproteobacteria bacterium]